MPKPNYSFQKRQRDMKKREKQEAKRQRRADSKNLAQEPQSSDDSAENPPAAPAEGQLTGG